MNNATFLPINLLILLVSHPSVIHELPACILRAIPILRRVGIERKIQIFSFVNKNIYAIRDRTQIKKEKTWNPLRAHKENTCAPRRII